MYIINCKIHTMEGTIIEDGFIKIAGKYIEQIGEMSSYKKNNSEVIDLKGISIYPGLVDAHTHLGMWNDSLGVEGDDGNETTDPITPNLKAIDAIYPFDICFEEALHAGITSVVTGPGSSNPIAGQMAAIKTYGKCIDDMIIKFPVAMKMSLGENPKFVYRDKDRAPNTRMAIAALIREQLNKTKKYLNNKSLAINENNIDEPEYDEKLEALIPVLKRKLPVQFHAHRTDDIFTAIRIAKEYNLKYSIVHATQAHLIIEKLKEEKVDILSGPFLTDRGKPELQSLTPETVGKLSKAGLVTAIITDHPEIPLKYMLICVAVAVKEGMDKDEALKSVTINPATICGIDKYVGSIKAGKDADLVAFDKDPINILNKPILVICNGKVIINKLL